MSLILYIEDDALLQIDGDAALKAAHHDVLSASDGEAGCALIGRHGSLGRRGQAGIKGRAVEGAASPSATRLQLMASAHAPTVSSLGGGAL